MTVEYRAFLNLMLPVGNYQFSTKAPIALSKEAQEKILEIIAKEQNLSPKTEVSPIDLLKKSIKIGGALFTVVATLYQVNTMFQFVKRNVPPALKKIEKHPVISAIGLLTLAAIAANHYLPQQNSKPIKATS